MQFFITVFLCWLLHTCHNVFSGLHTCICVHVHKHVCVHACMHAHTRVQTQKAKGCVCVCVCVCIFRFSVVHDSEFTDTGLNNGSQENYELQWQDVETSHTTSQCTTQYYQVVLNPQFHISSDSNYASLAGWMQD